MIARLQRVILLVELAAAAGIALALDRLAGWPPAAAAAAGVAAPLAVHAALIAFYFALARRAGSPTPGEHALGTAGALRLWLFELRDSIRTFTLAQPLLAGRPIAPAGAVAGRVPVLFVHGYFCNRALWRPLARRLAARGHPVDAVDLEPPFGSIDAHAATLHAAVERLRARAGADRVALVCHSMGGLAARAYVRARGCGALCAVITLGTPHRGTFHARLGRGTAARQMEPDSAWLRALAADEAAAAARGDRCAALFTVILTHHDNIVAPQAGQTVAGARTIELGGIGHVSLPYDPRVARLVEQALDAAGAGRQPAAAFREPPP